MFSDLWILIESFLTVRTSEHSIFFVVVDVFLKTGHLFKFLSTYWTVIECPRVCVSLDVSGQSTVGEESFTAVRALQWLRLVTAVHSHVLLQSRGGSYTSALVYAGSPLGGGVRGHEHES